MNEGRTISLAITSFNRFEWTIRSFHDVLYDDRISEVIISDDASDLSVYSRLENAVGGMDKVKLVRNNQNYGCYFNKHKAIFESKGPYCIILDSDNIISTSFIDKIFSQQWDENTILAPDMGEPALNYKALSGKVLTRENISGLLDVGNTAMALNTMNYFVNRKSYLEIFDDTIDPITSDSIYINYLWLKSGRTIKIVDGLSYTHSIHPDSHYTTNCYKLPGFYDNLLHSIRQLK